MYGLRRINNMYVEHAGTRSDFIVVGHPEFNLGKMGSSSGYGKGWVDSTPPCFPKVSPAVFNVIRKGGADKTYERLGIVTDGPAPNPRERALARSQSAAAAASDSSRRPTLDEADVRHSCDAFLVAIKSPGTLPPFRHDLMRVTQGAGNHTVEGSGCRRLEHFEDELQDLMNKMRREPAETERDLRRTQSWKYYAHNLEMLRRREHTFQRRGRSSLPAIKKHHNPDHPIPGKLPKAF
jgi:hypothetical protein